MSYRVDPDLLLELKQYGEEGAVNIEACFNCGTCTATCPVSRVSCSSIETGLSSAMLC